MLNIRSSGQSITLPGGNFVAPQYSAQGPNEISPEDISNALAEPM